MDKEKIVRDLVNSFDSRSELHQTYKKRLKDMMMDCIENFLSEYIEKDNFSTYEDVEKWIDNFVESRTKLRESNEL